MPIDKLSNFRGMDKDTDLSSVAPGRYLDARNIQFVTGSNANGGVLISALGNELAFTLPSISTQNKIYRITLGTDGVTVHSFTFYRTNGASLATGSYTEGANIAASRTALSTALTTALGAATPAQTFTLTHSGNDSFITLTTVTGYEYTLVIDAASDVTVTQEAYDTSLTGQLQMIGSYDLLGTGYIFSTQQGDLPEVLGVTITTATNATPVVITTSAAHGLSTGTSVSISGVSGSTTANGSHVITVLSATTFRLLNTVAGGAGTGGTITKNTQGVGEIGVAVFNNNEQTWSYTTLLRTKEWNFRTKKQIDCDAERTNLKDSVYFTDDYNNYRCFYYSGAYVSNGAIAALNSTGTYSYGSIAEETQLVLSNSNIDFSFSQQIQSGGGIKSGNWRYSVSLLSDSLARTAWLPLSNPVPVFDRNTNDPYALIGDAADTITSKINEFTVSGLTVGLFKYIELAGVNYIDGAISGYILSRTLVTQETITLRHTGLEPAAQNLDIALLTQQSQHYATAKSVSIIDNRLVFTNLTSTDISDFGDWAATIKHAVKRGTINGVRSNISGTLRTAEYQLPENVNDSAGYMDNETYRFGVRAKLKVGGVTDVFWVDDIRIDTSATTPDGRRTGGLPTYDLTTSGADPDVYVRYIEFSNIDLDFLVGGVRIRDLVDELEFVRADCVPEVLACGVFSPGVYGPVSPTTPFVNLVKVYSYDSPNVDPGIGEYPLFSGDAISSQPGVPSQTPYPGNWNAARAAGSFYSPDIYWGGLVISHQSSDSALTYGSPQNVFNAITPTGAGADYGNSYTEFNGYTNKTSYSAITLSAAAMVSYGSTSIVGSTPYSKLLREADVIAIPYSEAYVTWKNPTSLVIESGSNFVDNNGAGNTDYGLYYIQYYRALTDKYGPKNLTKYIPTGSSYAVTSSSPGVIGTGVIEVFGGDTFTQKSYLKHRVPQKTTGSTTIHMPGGILVNPGGNGGGISFYSQNKINSQLRNRATSVSPELYPNINTSTWLDNTLAPDPSNYNHGYDIVNGVNSDIGFDENAVNPSDFPARIIYSDLKPQGSPQDQYRVFLPLNFKDLDLAKGEITHHANVRGELITWQERKEQRQFFNTTGQLEVGNESAIIIGDGSVLSREGMTLTSIGSKHKWSFIRGKSVDGNDVVYWINTELKKVMRKGADGTVCVSDLSGMIGFFLENLTWVDGFDIPASGRGICGVWDDINKEAIWTIRGHKDVTAWNTGAYLAGAVVSYTPSSFSTFEATGEIYRALVNNTNVTPDTHPLTWEVISHDDPDYYNEYTIAWNEWTNTFMTFYSFKPKIYFKLGNSFLSPKPVSNQGLVYQHNKGEYCSWYGGGQVEDGYVEFVFNRDQNAIKECLALWINSEITPKRIDFTTKNHVSFLVNTDFETYFEQFVSAIKNDSTGTGSNEGDTSRLWGQYLKIKITFEAEVFQKVVDIIVKYNSMNRNYRN